VTPDQLNATALVCVLFVTLWCVAVLWRQA